VVGSVMTNVGEMALQHISITDEGIRLSEW
jgi:hypothetical protein